MKRNAKINTGVVGNLLRQKGAVAMSNVDTNKTLGQGCEIWLYQYKKNSVKKGTFARLLTSLEMMKKYPIATLPVLQINTDSVQQYINQLVKDGYALTTIKKQYNLITGYVRYLIGEGVAVNPIYMNVQLPSEDSVEKHKKEVAAYNMIEQKKLIEVCSQNNSIASCIVALLIDTGMRIGELLALRWEDILWERQAVWVHRTLVTYTSREKAVYQGSAKSNTSNRKIPLSRRAMATLGGMLERTKDVDGLIFPSSEDNSEQTIGYNTCRNIVSEFCKMAGVKFKGFHMFRHTFATNCYYKGCDVKKLSKLLGHSNVSITYNTYIHLFGDGLEELRSIVE